MENEWTRRKSERCQKSRASAARMDTRARRRRCMQSRRHEAVSGLLLACDRSCGFHHEGTATRRTHITAQTNYKNYESNKSKKVDEHSVAQKGALQKIGQNKRQERGEVPSCVQAWLSASEAKLLNKCRSMSLSVFL